MFTGLGQRSNGCCFLFAQSDEPEEHGPEIIRLLAAKGNHKRRIAELTAMQEVDVLVTTVEHSTSVRLPVGVLVDMSCVAAGVSMLWCPPSESKGECDAGIPPVIEQSRTESAAEERVSLCEVAPVKGVLLRQWGSFGSGEGQFNEPEGMCVSGGEVFVCGLDNRRIQVFARDGSFVRQWAVEGNPRDVAVSEGEVFVCDSRNNCIQVFGVDGSFVRQWGTRGSGQGELNMPAGVAVSDGELLVSEFGNARIQVFDVAGTFLRQWGTNGNGEGQLDRPRGLAVSAGEVYVCDAGNNRVVVFGLDGSFVAVGHAWQWGWAVGLSYWRCYEWR